MDTDTSTAHPSYDPESGYICRESHLPISEELFRIKQAYTKQIHYRNETFTVRPIMPYDEAREMQFAQSLSVDSIYKRFFRVFNEILPKDIHALTHVDYTKDFALAAVDEHDKFVAVARYATGKLDITECDMAVIVADTHQRKGIGKMLINYLIEIARERGKKVIRAEVLRSNRAAINLVESVQSHYQTTISHQIETGSVVYSFML